MSDVAIVGMSCRFPGAGSLADFWQLLLAGKDSVNHLPEERLQLIKTEHAEKAGYLEDIESFDYEAFSMSLREAKLLDPQQRLLLETTWHALEDAHTSPKAIAGKEVGVFTGVMGNEWSRVVFSDPDAVDIHTGTGNGYCMLANRLSYFFQLSGPSLSVDTACSSSLVATDLACKSLMSHESNMAIVAGANIILNPHLTQYYKKAGLASTIGACQSFGRNADGIVRGEGVGVVVLKRLTDALQDENRIYAVIKGSAINHNSRSNGITAPNRFAQSKLITKALNNASIDPNEIYYVEAHGTGTVMGDPIEANGLGEALGQYKKEKCFVGSVKSNIGHCEGAAGIAGLIKTALSIYHRTLVPTLHFNGGNPYVNFDKNNLEVVTSVSSWPENKLMAGVSSFGLGGSNAHLVLAGVKKPSVAKQIDYYPFKRIKINNTILPFYYRNDASKVSEKLANKSNIFEIVALICESPIDKVTNNSRFIEDLGFDSIMFAELVSALKKENFISDEVDYSHFLDIKTVAELANYLNEISGVVNG